MKSILIQTALLLGTILPSAHAGEFAGSDQEQARDFAAGGVKPVVFSSKGITATGTHTYTERRCDEDVERSDVYGPLLCYYDSAGNLHHWAWSSTEQRLTGTDFWGREKPLKTVDVFVSGYALIREKQRAYNVWIKSNRSSEIINRDALEPCGSMRLVEEREPWRLDAFHEESIPRRIPEDGRLRVHTFNLPNIYAKCYSVELHSALAVDCDAAGGSREICQQKLETKIYPNPGLDMRNSALIELQRSIDVLFKMVKDLNRRHEYFANPQGWAYGSNDLLPERLPADLIEKFRVAGDDVTAKMENARMLQEAYRSQYDSSK